MSHQTLPKNKWKIYNLIIIPSPNAPSAKRGAEGKKLSLSPQVDDHCTRILIGDGAHDVSLSLLLPPPPTPTGCLCNAVPSIANLPHGSGERQKTGCPRTPAHSSGPSYCQGLGTPLGLKPFNARAQHQCALPTQGADSEQTGRQEGSGKTPTLPPQCRTGTRFETEGSWPAVAAVCSSERFRGEMPTTCLVKKRSAEQHGGPVTGRLCHYSTPRTRPPQGVILTNVVFLQTDVKLNISTETAAGTLTCRAWQSESQQRVRSLHVWHEVSEGSSVRILVLFYSDDSQCLRVTSYM